MNKVLVERPRKGPFGKAGKKGKRESWDTAPKFEPMNRYSRHRGDKVLNENLAPLYRYLRSQVGRPWDKVYSAISEHVHRGNAVQNHILQHAIGDRGIVELAVFEENGIVWRNTGWPDGPTPVRTRWPLRPNFYVCPRTRLLRLAPKTWPQERKLWQAGPRYSEISATLWLATCGRGNGKRFWTLRVLPMKKRETWRDPTERYHDVWMKRPVYHGMPQTNWLGEPRAAYLAAGLWCAEATLIDHKEARHWLSVIESKRFA